jgi:hypothetical protein
MSKGYLIFAQGDYVEMANLLSNSIRSTQSKVKNVCVITDGVGDVMLNRTQAYKLSPFDETVLLDADMIFLDDISHWWDHFEKFPLLITDKVKTYRGNWVTKSPYRKTFISNGLPNCYSAFCYFKKDPIAEDFFNLLGSIVTNWNEWTLRYAPEDRQDWPSIDVAMGIALKVLDYNAFSPLDYPTFTHMKSGCQGWDYFSEKWTNHLACYTANNNVRLGNHIQSGILHYVDKEFYHELLHLF